MANSDQLAFKPLIGTEEVSIDDRGRVTLATKKRERLGANFAVCASETGCLVMYPEWRWNEILAEVFSGKGIVPGREDYSRLILCLADDEVNCDAQGRFVIPAKLREACRLVDRVLIMGMGDRVEIWSKSEWEIFNRLPKAYNAERRQNFKDSYRAMKESSGDFLHLEE